MSLRSTLGAWRAQLAVISRAWARARAGRLPAPRRRRRPRPHRSRRSRRRGRSRTAPVVVGERARRTVVARTRRRPVAPRPAGTSIASTTAGAATAGCRDPQHATSCAGHRRLVEPEQLERGPRRPELLEERLARPSARARPASSTASRSIRRHDGDAVDVADEPVAGVAPGHAADARRARPPRRAWTLGRPGQGDAGREHGEAVGLERGDVADARRR